ncbi:MAG: bifunctional histidinol-phosphatase/imidazoleglycerol-phosphate dehydratase HisB [Gammaproteobacteria bacterium]|nr:bifunctional histidinol-phosphatase/imidazoleglycerol-phosphate dehydratase HisB [Gammaproteobacteria bacterium]MDH5311958.1 bifunctional histidinol-phosphatase/imidazoleglycerol-phosphate dehydratase HisB [Gammaproteobacteria bacterium]
MQEKILFLDRDGTLIVEPPDEQVDRLDKVALVEGVIPALLALAASGFRFIMVTNQDGLGTDSFPREDFERVQDHVLALFASQGIRFDRIFVCPHRPDDNCGCRKPRTGLLTEFLASTNLDMRRSAVVGDRQTDIDLAGNIGIRGLLYQPGGPFENSWEGIRRALESMPRRATVARRTKETDIRVTVDLDHADPVAISTGIGFYDHMLEQIARHGGFSLSVQCGGDLHVDEHHTVEDTALAFGSALRQALGDKRGIDRYGFLLPMDESEARAAIDLSGRPCLVFDGDFPRQQVGGLATELVPHFFQSFADALGAAVHVEVRGSNTHHMVEACFKSVGRSLRQALRREGTVLPSTKGSLD